MSLPSVAAVQFEPAIGEVESNLERLAALCRDLPEAVELAVFPELCVTGYDLKTARSIAQPVPGGMTDAVVGTAERADRHLVVGLPEREGEALFNSLVHVSPAGIEGTYRKQRLWGDEAEVFSPGGGPTVTRSPAGRVGSLICYDLNFPEVCLEYAEAGVDVLAVSSAWRTGFLTDWQLLLRARALDGTCYTVGSNHVGDQQGREHAGHSLVSGPTGEILDECDETAAGSATAAVDSAVIAEARVRNPVDKYR